MATHVVNSKRELRAALVLVPQPVVQMFISGDLYTIDVFGNSEGRPICIVPRLREREFGSISGVSRIDMNDDLIRAAREVALALRVKGLYNFQLMRSRSNVVYLLDVNPRVAPGAILSMKAGAPFARWTADLIVDGAIADEHCVVEDGLAMMRYATQVFIRKNGIEPKNKRDNGKTSVSMGDDNSS